MGKALRRYSAGAICLAAAFLLLSLFMFLSSLCIIAFLSCFPVLRSLHLLLVLSGIRLRLLLMLLNCQVSLTLGFRGRPRFYAFPLQ